MKREKEEQITYFNVVCINGKEVEQKKELAGLTEPSHLRLNCIVYSLKKKKKKKEKKKKKKQI